MQGNAMTKRLKDTNLSLRTTEEVKDLLRQAAALDRRTVSSLVEKLVYDHAAKVGIAPTVKPEQLKESQ